MVRAGTFKLFFTFVHLIVKFYTVRVFLSVYYIEKNNCRRLHFLLSLQSSINPHNPVNTSLSSLWVFLLLSAAGKCFAYTVASRRVRSGTSFSFNGRRKAWSAYRVFVFSIPWQGSQLPPLVPGLLLLTNSFGADRV
jgi:hypothetical protein